LVEASAAKVGDQVLVERPGVHFRKFLQVGTSRAGARAPSAEGPPWVAAAAGGGSSGSLDQAADQHLAVLRVGDDRLDFRMASRKSAVAEFFLTSSVNTTPPSLSAGQIWSSSSFEQ
jgi:hypothetical protein